MHVDYRDYKTFVYHVIGVEGTTWAEKRETKFIADMKWDFWRRYNGTVVSDTKLAPSVWIQGTLAAVRPWNGQIEEDSGRDLKISSAQRIFPTMQSNVY